PGSPRKKNLLLSLNLSLYKMFDKPTNAGNLRMKPFWKYPLEILLVVSPLLQKAGHCSPNRKMYFFRCRPPGT
ncbi:hypothetical protein, partial [Anaeromassilibacillus sp. 1001302B_160321_C8]|uniref:hypothetical protein n=1 Tax=Anaeromassilibacillus sp. 1001302B_160321_C8 TaxID=2787132 RepID=UPI001A9C254F